MPLAEFLSDIPGQQHNPADRLRMKIRGLLNYDLAAAIF